MLFHQKGGSASFGTKMVPLLDPLVEQSTQISYMINVTSKVIISKIILSIVVVSMDRGATVAQWSSEKK